MLVYVDDIILTGNNNDRFKLFIDQLSTRFSLKDLGNLSYFLGMEALRTSKGLLLHSLVTFQIYWRKQR